jgi:hypothetical protein
MHNAEDSTILLVLFLVVVLEIPRKTEVEEEERPFTPSKCLGS